MRALVEDPADGRQRSGLSGCMSTRCEGAAGMGRASPRGGVVLLRHEMRYLYLRPLPLRERAALGVRQIRLGEGASSLDSNVETPHPILFVETPSCPLPQGARAQIRAPSFLTQ